MTTDDPSPPSHRQIKKAVKSLRTKEGWDIKRSLAKRESPEEALARDAAEQSSEKAYLQAESCSACDAIREELDDVTALCETHMQAAFGL